MLSGQPKQTMGSAAVAAAGAFGPRILALDDHLAKWSETPDHLTCTYLTNAHRAVAAQLREWMQAAEIDTVGNVVGRYAAGTLETKTLIVASHYDTVRNAGKYDGRLGILAALVVVERLNAMGRGLPFNLEVIGFSEEEGVRFGTAYLGSSAVAGRFERRVLERRDASGLAVDDLIRSSGGNPDAIATLARQAQKLLGYLEIHIEQGPVLLTEDLPVGIGRAGLRPHYLPSGAGHNAVMFDGVTDIGMLFVRCGNGGVSHSPLESISANDVDIAAKILLNALMSFHEPR